MKWSMAIGTVEDEDNNYAHLSIVKPLLKTKLHLFSVFGTTSNGKGTCL